MYLDLTSQIKITSEFWLRVINAKDKAIKLLQEKKHLNDLGKDFFNKDGKS